MSEIKYRNGVPTRSCMIRIIDDFFPLHCHVALGYYYGKKNGIHTLRWETMHSQARMDDFIHHLNDIGIKTGTYNPYKSPTVGRLEILKK